MLGTGAVVALHGIYQFLFQVGPEGFVLFGRFMRAHGTFEQPNPFAAYLGLILPVALGLVAAAIVRNQRRVGRGWLLWASGSGLVMAVALVMSWSRGAWIGFAAGLAAMLLAVIVRNSRAAVLVLVVVLAAGFFLMLGGTALIPDSLLQRFSDFVPYLGIREVRGVEVTDANFAVIERVAHWQSALQMWTEHPWLGVGAGNYPVVYDRYAMPLWSEALGHAHNYYLNIAAEAGTVGLAAYLLLWGAALVVAWRATRRTVGWSWGVSLGVLAVVVHLCVHSFFDNLYVHSLYLQVAMLLGIQAGFLLESPHRHGQLV
jgi:O-antigen ligase